MPHRAPLVTLLILITGSTLRAEEPDYPLGPDSQPRQGVPTGTVTKHSWTDSKIFPGTTRDSVDVRIEKEGKTHVVIDTAGVRKKRNMVTNDIEFYSFHRAQRSVRRADVVLMLIDGTEHVSEPDKKLAEYIAEQHKPVILVINKWDLVLEGARKMRAAGKRTILFLDEIHRFNRAQQDGFLPYMESGDIVLIGAIALLLIYYLAVEELVQLIPKIGSHIHEWLPFNVANKFLRGSAVVDGPAPSDSPLSPGWALAYFAGVAVVFLLVALGVAKKRDA